MVFSLIHCNNSRFFFFALLLGTLKTFLSELLVRADKTLIWGGREERKELQKEKNLFNRIQSAEKKIFKKEMRRPR
jgi:hypothetical protein